MAIDPIRKSSYSINNRSINKMLTKIGVAICYLILEKNAIVDDQIIVRIRAVILSLVNLVVPKLNAHPDPAAI